MHLSALRIRGFKSFPEQVELGSFPGVAVIVGRSSSGASNIPDSLQRVMSVSKRRARRSAGWTRRGSPCT